MKTVEEGGFRFVEGDPAEPFVPHPDEAVRIVEACFSADTDAALLYPANLPPAFFDLSSREAGEILQKLRNYRMRLAVVCAPGTVRFSSRFGELLAEERRGRHFGVFDGRAEAVAWLRPMER
jgi:hypothetical protein